MSRKHYIAIAYITETISNMETRRMVAEFQADYFASDNPNFNRSIYLTACGL